MEFAFTFDERDVTASFRSTVLGTYPIPKDISAEAYQDRFLELRFHSHSLGPLQ
jgi:hypothetical protein